MGRRKQANHTVSFSIPIEVIDKMEAMLTKKYGGHIPYGARSAFIAEAVTEAVKKGERV